MLRTAFLAVAVALCGCRSAKPQPEPPIAIARYQQTAAQAQGLSVQGNWPAAAVEWQKAADEASLLNSHANEAIALHNLADAQRHLAQSEGALTNATRAAELNEKVGRTNEWWRNQILLLQLEALATNRSPESRFEQLQPGVQAANPAIRGAFWNELGLWQQKQGELEGANETFSRAQDEYERANDALGIATVIANRARLFEARKQFELALRAWSDALKRFERLAEPQGIAHALTGHGRTLLAANRDLATAEEQLRRAARNFRNLKMESEARKATELLMQALAAQGKRAEPAAR
jgi:tetratricopeptide (TPR) repeat protein